MKNFGRIAQVILCLNLLAVFNRYGGHHPLESGLRRCEMDGT